MLTDVSLKAEIVKDDNKFHEVFLRNFLNYLMPQIAKWSDTLSKSHSKWFESDYKLSARFSKCMWPFWTIRH